MALIRVTPWRVALGLAAIVCQSLTEGLGLLMLGPLLQLVIRPHIITDAQNIQQARRLIIVRRARAIGQPGSSRVEFLK